MACSKLSEDAEHLQHHPSRGGAGVEGLGRRLQDDSEPVELLAETRELAHLAGETVDPVAEQEVEAALTGEAKRLLEAGALERDPARLVREGMDDVPVLHRLAVALEPLPLRGERGRLVVLIRRDARVETDPGHRRTSWQSGWRVVHETIDRERTQRPRQRTHGFPLDSINTSPSCRARNVPPESARVQGFSNTEDARFLM